MSQHPGCSLTCREVADPVPARSVDLPGACHNGPAMIDPSPVLRERNTRQTYRGRLRRLAAHHRPRGRLVSDARPPTSSPAAPARLPSASVAPVRLAGPHGRVQDLPPLPPGDDEVAWSPPPTVATRARHAVGNGQIRRHLPSLRGALLRELLAAHRALLTAPRARALDRSRSTPSIPTAAAKAGLTRFKVRANPCEHKAWGSCENDLFRLLA